MDNDSKCKENAYVQGLITEAQSILHSAISEPEGRVFSADETAAKLMSLCDAKSKDFELFSWGFWGVFIDEVTSSLSDTYQQRLVDIVGSLKSIEDKRALPENRQPTSIQVFGWRLRTVWNFNPDFEKLTNPTVEIKEWKATNLFAARLLSLPAFQESHFPIWALREALEEPLSTEGQRDAQLHVACLWLKTAGAFIHGKIIQQQELTFEPKSSWRPGPLFKDEVKSGYNSKRWNFWLERIEVLGKETQNQELKELATKTVEDMKALGT